MMGPWCSKARGLKIWACIFHSRKIWPRLVRAEGATPQRWLVRTLRRFGDRHLRERGTISVAEHGRLTQIQPAQLKPLLERRHQPHAPTPQHSNWSWRFRDISWKAVSLLLAMVLWLLFAHQVETVQRTYIIPIEYRNAPAGYLIKEQGANRAEVTLSGSQRAFGLLDAQALAVSADVSNVAPARPDSFPPQAQPICRQD